MCDENSANCLFVSGCQSKEEAKRKSRLEVPNGKMLSVTRCRWARCCCVCFEVIARLFVYQAQQNYWYILLPHFFCKLQLKVTLQTVMQKFSKIPQTPLYTAYIFFSKNTYCIKLYFEFDLNGEIQ